MFCLSHIFSKTPLLLINAFVLSKLFYSSTVWSNTSNTNVKILQLAQNFAGRIVLGLRTYDHISEESKSLRWLPIADKLLLNVSVMVYKCLNGRAPDYLSQKFTRRQVHHVRNSHDTRKTLIYWDADYQLGSDLSPLEGPTCLNKLPKDMKEVADCRIFKKRLLKMTFIILVLKISWLVW